MKMAWCVLLLIVLAVGTFLWNSGNKRSGISERFIFDNMRNQAVLTPLSIPAGSLASCVGDEVPCDSQPTQMEGKSGSVVYERYCACCHGINGDGKGAMAAYPEFPAIGSFRSEKYKDYPVEKIFRSIADGQGNMPSFSGRMTAAEIGAAVSRVIDLRKFQGTMNREGENERR